MKTGLVIEGGGVRGIYVAGILDVFGVCLYDTRTISKEVLWRKKWNKSDQIENSSILFSIAITFGTISYHFIIRLLVGQIFDMIMHNRADYTKKWYQVSDLELEFYQMIKVKKMEK